MSSDANQNNTDHLKVIEGEDKTTRARRLNKLRQQKCRAAQKLKDPEAVKAKATAENLKDALQYQRGPLRPSNLLI